ncbi:hypothetical protein SCHPADRAFT_898169 [Schizopora paradoxa]|uniref:F-box domain-containing protein n=1 Tax=Schizopora paradoxa TaxID=27342 RepID=A0A0H2SSM3_9AGAM|nr:hypothetical protein SCHPADRAFT_898169 [Schizopora paradoxa]
MNPNQVSFTSIPGELLLGILAFCNALDIIHCSQTCRSMHELVQTSPILQYAIELDIAGLCDTSLYKSSVNFELYHEFCARREIQKSMVGNDSLGLPSRTFRFSEGSSRQHCTGNALVRIYGSEKVTLTSLSTFESWTWDIPFNKRYKRFRVSPNMNIFVGVRTPENGLTSDGPIYLDVFDLKNGRQHPLAGSSCFTLTESAGKQIVFAPIIRIQNDLLFVWWTQCTPTNKIRMTSIINWRTGNWLRDDERSRIGCPRPLAQDFLIRQRFLEENSKSPIAIEVQMRTSRPQSGTDYPTVARFLFPSLCVPLSHHAGFFNIQINVTESEDLRTVSSTASRKFISSPSSQLVCLTWGAPSDYYTLVTHSSVFTNFSKYIPEDQGSDGSLRIIPWDKWGPANTRLLRTDCGSDQIHGNRLMLLNDVGGVKEILDFNQLDVARDKHRASSMQSQSDPHLQADSGTTFSVKFLQDIETSLPYRVIFRSHDRTPSWHLAWILREDIYSLSINQEYDEVKCYEYDKVVCAR